ncbi:MAG: hypothetical protein KME15_02625 [Drouetiella hepatica Uher 2000/2452]|jgi:hypothetical protein|uniref:Uncharacterized protein n=1 Tax=Drouetiella hepatica Uher 2000/2452 TaxID=904376 RepID=A0A951UL91_9CYAN|nr:hypothetical protein [Drouetiella hepatica Uher 2000/2452]
MATALHFNLDEIDAQHRAAIAASLTRRLEVAKAAQNFQLIALLEQEQQQLGLVKKQHGLALVAKVKQVWNSWMDAIAHHSMLSIDQIMSDSGTVLWRAYDPRTGKTLYAESESEVLQWIEDNDLGR